jgi:hypothetical protein
MLRKPTIDRIKIEANEVSVLVKRHTSLVHQTSDMSNGDAEIVSQPCCVYEAPTVRCPAGRNSRRAGRIASHWLLIGQVGTGCALPAQPARRMAKAATRDRRSESVGNWLPDTKRSARQLVARRADPSATSCPHSRRAALGDADNG